MNAQYHADYIGFNVTCPDLNSEDPCTTSDKVPCTSVNVWPCETTNYPPTKAIYYNIPCSSQSKVFTTYSILCYSRKVWNHVITLYGKLFKWETVGKSYLQQHAYRLILPIDRAIIYGKRFVIE